MATAIGLGCSRFGSLVAGTDRRAAARLIDMARDTGVCHFDTADIYGQGDSERFLGDLLGSDHDALITTKAGQRFPLHKRLILKAKPVLRPLMARSKAAAGAAGQNRAGLLPQDFGKRHLKSALEGSLRRLRRDAVDCFLLHSPTADVLNRGEAMATLADLQQQGKAVRIGASIDDAPAFTAAVADDRIQTIQLPLSVLLAQPDAGESARSRGVTLVVRELFAASTIRNIDHVMALVPAIADVALIGTGNAEHLREACEALARARSC